MQEPGSKIKFPGAPELNSFRKKGRIYPTFHLGRTVILAPGAIGLATTTRLVISRTKTLDQCRSVACSHAARNIFAAIHLNVLQQH